MSSRHRVASLVQIAERYDRVVLHWCDGHGHAYQVEDGSSTYRFRIRAGTLGSTIVDTIRGQADNDCILGGAGDDSLRGDGGTDVCIGGPGTDTFHSSCETQIQ